MNALSVGIDAGSRAIKIILLDVTTRQIVTAGVLDQGVDQNDRATRLFERLLNESKKNRDDVTAVIATGYGRNLVHFANETVTEITCHACGVHHLHPEARTVVEIGGQDSKLLCLNEAGKVRDFTMNDRCAAGTGRFLEVCATRLGVPLDALGELAQRSQNPAVISSMCVVFAETEIIGLLASGIRVEDIAAGVQASIATRVTAMCGRKVTEPVVFTGGVALVPGMQQALQRTLQCSITLARDPQMTGALGAALLAAKQIVK